MVETGNRLRLAQTELAREVERLLRGAVRRACASTRLELDAAGATLEALDAALRARPTLAPARGARARRVRTTAQLDLRGLRHPLLLLEAGLEPEDVVPTTSRSWTTRAAS